MLVVVCGRLARPAQYAVGAAGCGYATLLLLLLLPLLAVGVVVVVECQQVATYACSCVWQGG